VTAIELVPGKLNGLNMMRSRWGYMLSFSMGNTHVSPVSILFEPRSIHKTHKTETTNSHSLVVSHGGTMQTYADLLYH
jgi:hypothetical protein